ncbi:MAG: AAA family ATPase, partial [Nitrospirota bacterium]
MYYEYWGLKKPAFDNVPDPSMYVDCHSSMENAIAETLFAIEEGDECIAVIVGDVGLGKTMSIRMIIDSLDQEKYKIALITNPGISFVQILQEIIGQLEGKQCEEKRKVNLLEMFNRLLFSTFEEGRKILIFIDEANAITPVNLENLRLLTNMRGDKRNLFTMVLAGQIEFAKRLEHPKRANLFQRVGTYSRIDKLESVDKVRKYVETRVMLAGTTKKIFADDAFDKLWEHSDHGVPRLVNKLSKLCLKAGETNNFEFITGEIIEQIGSRFHKLTGPAIQKRRSRMCIREEVQSVMAEKEDGHELIDVIQAESGGSDNTESGETAFISQELLPEEQGNAESGLSGQAANDTILLIPWKQSPEESEHAEMDSEEEICIGQVRIKIHFPEHLMRQSLSSSQEHRFKLAGGLAAETLKKNPHLITSHSADPVPIWLEIRDFVLNRITHASSVQSLS